MHFTGGAGARRGEALRVRCGGRVPGVFQGQASSAYYYDADKKSWAPGLNMDISPLHK